MENPATWDSVERAVHEALRDHEAAQSRGVIGGSRVKAAATAARNAVLDEVEQRLGLNDKAPWLEDHAYVKQLIEDLRK